MSKQLIVDFHSLEQGVGMVDIAIRYDVKTGRYNYLIEENGLPVTLPMHVFNGILFSLATEACRGVINGYSSES